MLVTGAGGSIGSEICSLVAKEARRLTLVSLTENGLYTIDRHIRSNYTIELRSLLGSVGDACLMERALEDVDIVIHAAAHKHVPICEQNPVEAIRNNVLGTHTLAELSLYAGVQRFCMISSDKAVNPASIMGATKRLAELIVSGMNGRGASFVTVRFGNVLNSAGSVLPLWREQIAKGGPLTLTDERCERYFMSIPQAVRLVADVIDRGEPGTYVLDMGKPRKLIDMAYELMREMNQTAPIKFIGLRPGEKISEELHHGGELIPAGPGVFRVSDSGRVPNWHDLAPLGLACDHCDKARAVETLWSLVN